MPINYFSNEPFGSTFGSLTFPPKTASVSSDKLLDLSNAQTATLELSVTSAERALDRIVESAKKLQSKPPMPEVIMEREKKGGHYTTIKWSDGTYTTVKASEGDDGDRSPYMAFCAALAKKLYGSNSAVHRTVNRHMETYIADEKKKAAAQKRAKEREAERAALERAILREAKRLRLKEEAKAYNRAHRMDEE